MPLDRFLTRSRRLLRPHGFTARNSLALFGACRDELSMPAALAVREHWGEPFLLMSLAGLPTYGRSALAAAAHHAPDASDGVRRAVVILTTHIGIDRQGTVGQVQRPGQARATAACGALAACRLGGPAASLRRGTNLSDIEMQLLLQRLWQEYPAGATPSMEDFVVTCRRVIEQDFAVVGEAFLAEPGALTAVFTGIVVHGHPRGDYVDPGPATLFGADGGSPLQE